MYTPALLFRSLRISSLSTPPPSTSLPQIFLLPLQTRAFSHSPASPSSTSLPPPTPYFVSRSKRPTRSTVPSQTALEWSSADAAANAAKEFAHLVPVAPTFSSERERINLELAERFPEKNAREERVEEVVEVDPAHLYTAPPPLDPTTETASSPSLTQHFRTFLAHQKNLLAIHMPRPLSTYAFGKQSNPKERLAIRQSRWEIKAETWNRIARGDIETLSFEEAKALALQKRTAPMMANRKRKAEREGAPEADRLSERDWAEEMEERIKGREEEERKRGERVGIERQGFGKGGKERLFLEKYLGGEPKKDADGRGKETPIGRKRKVY